VNGGITFARVRRRARIHAEEFRFSNTHDLDGAASVDDVLMRRATLLGCCDLDSCNMI
jgi:hypothetical protein